MKRLTILILCFTVVALPCQAKQPAPRPVISRGELAADERANIEIFRRASPSVVYITTLDKVVDLWTLNVQEVPRGTGSGFVWDEQGHIVTNFHVIQGARSASVRLNDQQTHEATLVGASRAHDLAVLRIKLPEKKPAPLPLGSSRDLMVGQRVIAIGNPFGFDHTLTTGVISALDRAVPTGDGGANFHLIQTDAAINPGNSGGPLLDSAGRLIGVNTAIVSPSGASAGIGFAIPADIVNRVVPEIIAYGEYRRPGIGVEVNDRVSGIVTRQLGIQGVLIMEVQPGSPAAESGLKGTRVYRRGNVAPGDVILRVDGKPVDSVAEMENQFDGKRVGDKVTLQLWREGKERQVVLTLVAPKR